MDRGVNTEEHDKKEEHGEEEHGDADNHINDGRL